MQEQEIQKVRKLSYGVYLIGTRADGRLNGMTAAWVTQVSTRPPLVCVAVNKLHYTCEMIEKSGSFSVNVLTEEGFELAMRCGFGTGRDKSRLDGVELDCRKTGAPIIKGCAAYMDCELRIVVEAGDHNLYIGEVVDSSESGSDPMPYMHDRFFPPK